MVAAQGGDQAAYASLLTELGEAIERYLTRRFGRAPFIEDCVQESLISIHAARHTFDPTRPFQPWLFAIVRHRTIDWLRRAKRFEVAREQLAGPAQSDGADTDAPTANPPDGELGDCLQKLSKSHREALLLTKMYGFTISEAAQRAGVSETAMKVRVHRGIKKLQNLLEGLDAEFA